ncbi:MAG: CAP domain-containing protein [Gemmataceae bacterium]|nr:CAP domain-containing protein [Gemmataceae bacterium]
MSIPRFWVLAFAIAGFVTVPWSAGADKKEEKPKVSKEVQLLLDLTNEARAKQKLPPLKSNDTLAKAAMAFSGVMIKNDKKARELMDNRDPKVHELGGKNVDKRLDDVGYEWTECGENVAIALKGDQFRPVFEAWMKSKVHHDNIVSTKYDEIGIGIVKHPDKMEWYITQIFGSRGKD